MKRIIALILILAFATPAHAECARFLRKYNEDTTININVWLPDGSAYYTGADFVAGDILFSQSEAAQTNCTEGTGACVTDEGSFQSIAIDAAELDTKRLNITMSDVSGDVWLDKCAIVETFGDANAQFPTADVNMISVSGDGPAADNLETMLDGAGGGALTLGHLDIIDTTGDAVVISTAGGNGDGIDISGNGAGNGIRTIGGATGAGIAAIGGATSGNAISGTNTSGTAVNFSSSGGNGNGILLNAHGTGSGIASNAGATGNGIIANGGSTSGAAIAATNTTGDVVAITATAGNGDAIQLAGQGSGFGLNSSINGNITGALSGSVGSVTGAVGSVTGSVGSVTGSVGSVTGAVGSVTGNVGGNVVGSVASVTGNVGGNVTGSTGSVVGNVGGNVVGSVGSVVAPIDIGDFGSQGTAQSVGTNTIRLAASETYGDNALADHNSIWIEGATTGKGQVLCVKSNVASNDTVTMVSNWKIALTGTVTYRVVWTPNCNTAKWPVAH